jgi:sugar fermentation stimulation protein A
MVRLTEIQYDTEAIFVSRPNRFLAHVDIISPEDEKAVKVHVHDPGRLKELLYEGNRLLLKKADNFKRKTAYDVVAAEYQGYTILINSAYHRKISEKIFSHEEISPFGKINGIRAEVPYGKSRFDFLLTGDSGEDIWVETKGCTLTIDGKAQFPDAPTTRGRRHLEELMKIREEGKRAAVVFLVFRPDSICFGPKRDTDPEFSNTLEEAYRQGVEIYPLLLEYKDGIIYYKKVIELCF